MSETKIFGIKNGKPSRFLTEFENGRGFTTAIWAVYLKLYFKNHLMFANDDDDDYDQLWPLIYNQELPLYQRLVLFATYDYAMLPVEKLDLFIDCLKQWDRELSNHLKEKNWVNHVPDLMVFLEENKAELMKKYQYIGFDSIGHKFKIDWNSTCRKPVSLDQLRDIIKILHIE